MLYNSTGWLKVSRENIVCKQAVHVLQESQDKVITNKCNSIDVRMMIFVTLID